MLQRKTDPPRGVLHFGRSEPFLGVKLFMPCEQLRPFIEHYWTVAWEHQPPVKRETVPQPSMHLVLEPGQSKLHGIHRRRFTRIIEGTGRVLGVKFRPGGFYAFAGVSIARFTGKIVQPETVFGPSIHPLESQVTPCADAEQSFDLIDAYLRRLHPIATTELKTVSDIVQAIAMDRTMTRVDTVVAQFDIGLRQLQRIFRDYVGVSPKWVIQRHRLIEAAERIRDREGSIDFVGLALDLGYSDQSHFIRDFKNMVGKTPAEYRQSLDTSPKH